MSGVEKRNSFLRESSVSPHFILLLAIINNAKKESSALNSIDMIRPDTRLLSRNCDINCLKLGRSEQIRETNLWGKFWNADLTTEEPKLAFLLCKYKLRYGTFWCDFLFHPLPETQEYQLKQSNCFIPRINLLTLRCFVAEVRWLLPVNNRKKRKPRKRRNTEPWLELNQNTAITEISAYNCMHSRIRYLFISPRRLHLCQKKNKNKCFPSLRPSVRLCHLLGDLLCGYDLILQLG